MEESHCSKDSDFLGNGVGTGEMESVVVFCVGIAGRGIPGGGVLGGG